MEQELPMDADAAVTLVLVVLGLLVAAGLPVVLVEKRWRWRWQEIEIGRIPVESGPGVYRQGGTVPAHLRRAPRLVVMAAFTCLLFGQMFVPGMLLGLFGLVACGLGLVSIPGLITAAKLYGAGLALLRRHPRAAYFQARRAADWALWLNGIVFGLSLLVELTPYRATRLDGGLGFLLFVNGYGLLSVLQALLLRHTVERHEDALFAPTSAVMLNGALIYRVDRSLL